MVSAAKQGFIVIEGSDAAGKSVLGERLSGVGHSICIESPPEPLLTIKNDAVLRLDPVARLLYFMSGNAELSSIAAKLGAGSRLVGIRYIWSTIAYYSAIEAIDTKAIFTMLESVISQFTMPELVIFLTVQHDEQMKRIESRGETANPFEERLIQSYQEAFELVPAHVIEVDTTFTSVDGLVASLAPHIGIT